MKIYLVQQARCPKKLLYLLQFHGMVQQPFFVNDNGIKVNKESHCQHLCKEFFPAIEKVLKCDDWIFAQIGVPYHQSHLVQGFLKTRLKHRFIRAEEWPPSSPDVNPLDCFYQNFLKITVYKGRSGNRLHQNLN